MIGAVSILSGAIEIIGLIRDRSAKGELPPISNQIDLSSGPHTNVTGDQKNLLSGSFNGPTSVEGNAVDMRNSEGAINEAKGPVNQHFGDNITQIIKHHEKQLIPRIQPPPQKFVGREEDIKDILKGFEGGAMIAGLRGMGGVGKTALALVLVKRLAERYPDGQVFVDMKGTSNNPLNWTEAMIQVIHAYDLEYKMPMSEDEFRGRYFSILHGKRAILLLDNASGREQVEPLMPPQGCALLVTSRKKFALPGLAEKNLDVLPLEDASELLLEICGRIGDHAEKLAKLCGCLPIALRNAAYALKESPNMSPEGYIKRLADASKRLELVEASFSTSYDLLTPELQRLWSKLSVFPADFDLDGAAAVWDIEETGAEDALGELLRWSLVDYLPSAAGEGGRYKLHDLARDFAESRLDAADIEQAKLRHSQHYRDMLSETDEHFLRDKDGVLKGLKLFDKERANIQSGQSWAETNQEKTSAAIDLSKSHPDAGAHVLDLRLSPREKITWLDAAVRACRSSNDENSEGPHLGNLGSAYLKLGDFRKAIKFYSEALKIIQKIGDRRSEAAILGLLGVAYSCLGKPRKAIEFYEQDLKISQEIGNRRDEGTSLGNLGIVYKDMGEHAKAIEYYKQSLQISREIGDKRGEGARLGNLGVVYSRISEPQKAIEFIDQALKISREIGDRRAEGDNLGNMGIVYKNLGEFQKAIKLYDQALHISREIGDRQGESASLGNLGIVYKDMGEHAKAIEYCNQALQISREIGERRSEGNHLFNMSLSLCALGQQEKAISLARSALAIYEQIESPHAEAVRKKLAEWSA